MKSLVIGNAYSHLDGGGIAYSLGIANSLASIGHEVDYTPGYKTELKQEESLLAQSHQNIRLINLDLREGKSLIYRIKRAIQNALKYDYIFIQSIDIPDFTFNRNSYVFCDFPRKTELTLGKRIRLTAYKKIIANSTFTASWIQKYWNRKAEILYPSIEEITLNTLKKNIILTVGRFASGERTKNHLELVETFIKMSSMTDGSWEFHLAGFVQDEQYLGVLKEKAAGFKIFFHENITRKELEECYAVSKIYWHACGINSDENSSPQLMEHFGISTAEAMSAGCVPVVINKGGQPEIVDDAGYTFYDSDSCIENTLMLINDINLFEKMSKQARKRSFHFQSSSFSERIKQIIA